MKKLLILALLVINSVVSAKTYYVATTGKDSNLGTIASPWGTWKKGFETAVAGDTVYIRGGIYKPADVMGANYIQITGRNGTSKDPICIFAYPADYESGSIPTLDCSLQVPSDAGYNTAVQIGSSSHYKFKGLTICNVWQSPIGKMASAWGFYECNNLYFEACTAHQIGGRGFYVLNYSPTVVDSTFFINCDAYDCADSLTIDGNGIPNPGNGADGFFIQMTYDFPANYCLIEGCRAWRCSDDQFNLDQDCLTVTRNCWAFSGGYSSLARSEGNGFKIGDPNPKTPEIYSRITYNCISAGNKGFGYDPNNGLGDEWPRSLYYNNLSYKNTVGFLVQNCTESPLPDTMNIYRNNISYLDSYAAFENVPCLQNTPYYYTVDHCTWQKSEGYNGCMGLPNPTYNVTNDDFQSLDISELDNPRKSDGSLPDINFGKLKAGSDLIDGGIADKNFIRLGLTYSGTAPGLGYCVTNTVLPANPAYVSSVVENPTPSRLEMTYSLNLASIVPAASAFSVTVNASARSVSAVNVSGTKVLLALTSPVLYGDVVTVAYTQPATNPLQTPSGGKAASLTSRSVTNNVLPASPVYVSSVVENATPSRLEMTYSLNLANIVPATSAFSVTVNASASSVSAVTISGSKVLLTLASPILSGDVVTVSYTKPVVNPLQTSSGGQAVSISAKSVINNCSSVNNQPPTISITSPTKAVTFTAPANVTIEANASDSDGTIGKVEFYNGSTKLGEKLAAPFSYTWKDVPEGRYSITAIATDNLNAKTVSTPVEVVVEKSADAVNQLPVVSVTSPAKYKKGKKHDNFVLKAEAYDPDGSIVNVSFKNGSITLAEITTPPYEYTWEDVDTGTFIITAIATDNRGAVTASSPLELKILEWDAASLIINLYPSPNDGCFTFDYNNVLANQKNIFSIVNLSGKTVFSDVLTAEESTRYINISNQSAGTYVLVVSDGKEIIATKKFIKK